MSVLAVVLAVVALAINFAVAGPAGPRGPAGARGQECWDLNGNGVPDLGTEDRNLDAQVNILDCTGAQGPPGSGTLMATDSASGGSVSGSCFDILTVFIAPAVQGTIVVTTSLTLTIEHTTGTPDRFDLYASCAGTIVGSEVIPADLPTTSYTETVAVQWVVPVGSPGAYTISVGVSMGSGASAGDQILSLRMVAVFYPT